MSLKDALSIHGPEKRTSKVPRDQSSPGKKRLFLGTFLPPVFRQSLEELHLNDARLSETWSCKLRWVAGEKLHLTWLFLGLVEDSRIPEVKSIVDEVLSDQPSLGLSYSKPALWPHRKQARHFVLIPDLVPEEIAELAGRFSNKLRSYTERPENKPYSPHITILRLDAGHGSLSVPDWLGLDQKLPMHHEIDQIDLIESHLGGSKEYQTLFTWSRQA